MYEFIVVADFWNEELNGYTSGFYAGLYRVEAHDKREALENVKRDYFEEVKDAESFTVYKEV